ncbi:MAG: SDR family NAD(P)-dependent oxidoreductase [Hyphomicrobium sp.]
MRTNSVALVTGGNRGLGKEIARQLSRLGMRTIIGARDEKKGADAAAELTSNGFQTASVVLDVDLADSVSEAVSRVTADFGNIEILINNAGIAIESLNPILSTFLSISPDVALKTFSTNTLGPMRMMQAVLPHMAENNYGRIVNVSSRAGQLQELRQGLAAYRMSKTALNSLTRAVAAEYAQQNIKINCMCPGWIRTAMGGNAAPLTAEEGADTAIWLATLPSDGPTGGFYRSRQLLQW